MAEETFTLGQDIDLNIWNREQAMESLKGKELHIDNHHGVVTQAWVENGFVLVTVEN